MSKIMYPPTRREDSSAKALAADPYRWLEDDVDDEVEEWLAAQNRLLTSHAPSWTLRTFFQQQLREMVDACGTIAPPLQRGTRRFFLRHQPGQELPVLMTSEACAEERVLIDPLTFDDSGLTTLESWRPSWTGHLVAFQLNCRGEERPQLHVLNVDNGCAVDQPMALSRPTPVAWLPDDSGFYYVTGAPEHPTRSVRLRHFGTDPLDDLVVFETTYRQLSVMISPDGHWLTVSCASGAGAGNLLYVGDLRGSGAAAPRLRCLHDGAEDGTQAVVKYGPLGLLYMITNSAAPGGRVCVVIPDCPSSRPWSSVITVQPAHVLSACVALVEPDDARQIRFLTVSTAHGRAHLTLYDLRGTVLAHVPTPGSGPGTVTQLTTAPGETSEAWFQYTDFVTPPAVYRFTLHDRRVHSSASRPAQTGPIPKVRQLSYPSLDGTDVPMYLVLPPGPVEGPRPTILTAYGGFGATAAATYSPSLMAWVNAGGIYAIAGVRGGGEMGSDWHAAGRGPNKPNAFADFSAAARWLHTQGWTTPSQLAIRGSSHSGLMVAAALTRDPRQYAAAVCSDALTDMVRYPRFGLGAWWLEEFGDPEDPQVLQRLLSYSPYHNVQPGTTYPAVLLTSARHDPRVGAAHIRKFTAALQHATTSRGPVLLRTENDVGHGPRAASRLVDLQADALAFCAAYTGLG
ncbi:prolyl oligopeptidase family serine peptidase [Streptomyces roseus]|uniref:prolyl oligopeptidase family serine peptidase n=1 Tax=Streptomyces roseus TaxID=66430 RepID=UPI0036867B8C